MEIDSDSSMITFYVIMIILILVLGFIAWRLAKNNVRRAGQDGDRNSIKINEEERHSN